MSAKSSRKKKKSFLEKFSRAFAKKKSKSGDEEYSSDEESSSVNEEETSSPSGSSRSQTPVASPRKKKHARALEQASRELAARGEPPAQQGDSNAADESARRSSETPVRGVGPASASPALPTDPVPRLPTESANGRSPGEGSDKNLEAKTLFMRETAPVCFPAKNAPAAERPSDEKPNAEFEVITLRDVDPGLSEQLNSTEAKTAGKFLTNMIKSETVETDSESDEWSDSECDSSGDENTDFLEAERDELDYGELYFTKGKYMSFFFLQMERQGYDPNDVYTIIRYHDDESARRAARRKKGNTHDTDGWDVYIRAPRGGFADRYSCNCSANVL